MSGAGRGTIAAIATPAGEGALAIVRLSGAGSLEIADRIFRGHTTLGEAKGSTVHHGNVVSGDGALVDEVLATVFRAPHSYTGENAVEFTCHGGALVTQSVLKAALEAGAALAEPGEFSKRAFLSGRIDLSQAEAVADLIAARSERARSASLQQLKGRLGEKVRELRSGLTGLCALLELDLDFTEEGLTVIEPERIEGAILEVDRALKQMTESFEAGRIVREGVSVVLAGKPNAGKSSLFNALLKEHRAIVTPLPGTTRDTIEESLVVNGVLFRLIDTAGLRSSSDMAEAEGVRRAVEEVGTADIVLLVEDLSFPIDGGQIEEVLRNLSKTQSLIVALNKSDLAVGKAEFPELSLEGIVLVETSAKTGDGVEQLRGALFNSLARASKTLGGELLVTRVRHQNALQRARGGLSNALGTLREGKSNEFIALDVREAVESLGEITGEVTGEDILNQIFSNFCIGK
jgi:tRNA modification GTPase